MLKPTKLLIQLMHENLSLKVNFKDKLFYKRMLLSLISLSLIGLTNCENDINEINAYVNREDLSIEKTKEVELIYSDSAIIKVIVNAPMMHTIKDKKEPRQEFPDGIKVDFYDGGTNSVSWLTAKNAIRYDRKKEIVMRDSVVWQSKKNELLESEELIWNETTKKVSSKRFVKITTEDDIIYGYGFEAEEDFTKWKILAPQGTMSVENNY